MSTAWWKEAVVYHLYPRSFADSDGDGVGDLRGLHAKLDHLSELGVDVVMLGPVYSSPNDDNGYDVSDYHAIMDEFGTMTDWYAVRDAVHARGMKLLMDLVLNHTSDEHPWFLAARESRDSPYRDYYHWHPGDEAGGPPNNWASVFSGPAWEFDERTGEYYLHLYSRKQPDLNWENPKVRAEIRDIVEFWLDRGVDGFRLDTITTISKVPGYPSAPVTIPGSPYQPAHSLYFNGPRIHEFLRELHDEVFAGRDVLVVGEAPGVTSTDALNYLDAETGSMNLLLQWEHIEADPGSGGKWQPDTWTPRHFKRAMNQWQRALDGRGWNTLYLSNHDQPRQVSRFGDEERYWAVSAKMLATCLHTLRGTPFVYQGEELGMTNVDFPSIDDYQDLESRNYFRDAVDSGVDPATALARVQAKSRDNGRVPMPWTGGAGGGFTTGEPWIGPHPDRERLSAQRQLADPDSVFRYYQRLIRLRKEHPVLVHGDFSPLLPEHEAIYAYTRRLGERSLLVLVNFSAAEAVVPWAELPDPDTAPEPLIANYEPPAAWGQFRALRPFEAVVHLTPEAIR